MGAEHASKLLHARLRDSRWLTGIGVGMHESRPAIVVYVKRWPGRDLDFLTSGWMGVPVIIQKMGAPRPLRVLGASNSANGNHFAIG